MAKQGSLSLQFKSILPLLIKIYIPTTLALVILVIINLMTGIRVSYFTRDPVQIMEAPLYYGIFSNVGILLWCAAASICFFTATLIWRVQLHKQYFWFILCSGCMTTFLLFDDLFLFHEEVFPTYLYIPDIASYTGYGVGILIFLVAFHKLILQSEFLLLSFAFIFFAISIAIDIPDIPFYGQHLIEDGCKLFGIVSWATYFIHFCLQPRLFAGSALPEIANYVKSQT